MNIKTYTAKDMRSALRQVREEQGADAVILSTRHLPEGVEVAVAIESQKDEVALPEVVPARAAGMRESQRNPARPRMMQRTAAMLPMMSRFRMR